MRSFGQWAKKYREQLGISQEELGKSIDRSKSWVADLERGRARPKTEDIRQICFRLDLSLVDGLAIFLQELTGGINEQSLLEFEMVAQRWADEVISFEPEPIERVKPRSRAEIEKQAERSSHSIFGDDAGELGPVPLDLLLAGGCEHRKLEEALQTEVIFGRVDEPVPFDASTSRGGNGALRIDIRSDIWRLIEAQDGRARFTLAHELGHATLHQEDIVAGSVVYRDGASMPANTLLPGMKIYESPEWQANVFAAAFLMPRSAMEHWLMVQKCSQEESVEIAKVSTKFGVSYEAAKIRVERLLASFPLG